MKRFNILILMPMSFLLGCSTYSKKDCLDMDWYVEGKKAALDGYTAKQGKTLFVDKCQEDQKVTVDWVDFDRGFSSGLIKLCTPEGLKALEERDVKYQGTCETLDDELSHKKTRTSELESKNRKLEAEISRLNMVNDKLAAEVESLKTACPAQN